MPSLGRLHGRLHTFGTGPMFITSCVGAVNAELQFAQSRLPCRTRYTDTMLFMVTIGQRFRREGRMLPEGVIYQTSWIDPPNARCFQVMEAPSPASLNEWIRRWNDLVDFEIIPVVGSAEYWATIAIE
ncbi:MAG: hypothetical protein DMG80_06070 [Acidobacteria bacterium]|nr:MAG: hypothetical protein DMG80_06070 [Acidobacteriota bacterium]